MQADRSAAGAVTRAVGVTLFVVVLIVVGSRNLHHFDAALVAYTFATLFAVFGITYRYSIWLRRPPTAMYWRRGWQVFFRRGFVARNLRTMVRRVVGSIALNDFIRRRDRHRWIAHLLIMWGCFLAVAITFPLVFGWIHFETLPGPDFERYRIFLFGFPTVSFPTASLVGFVVFHGLVWASLLVIAGVMLALRRRMREHGAEVLQQFGEDFLPLILLFAVSMTGLMLTASYTWMRGFAYTFLAILHAVTVIFTLLWLPFGKFFHVFQRPAQLGVSVYKDVGAASEQAPCARCGEAYASRMHIDDLITVEEQLGYRYGMPDSEAGHYQRVCPQCRRAMLALAQGALFAGGEA